MRLLLMMMVAAGVLVAVMNPEEIRQGVDLTRTGLSRASEAIQVGESVQEQARREAAYEAWLESPYYDVKTLETLWRKTERYEVLLLLAEATMGGCGPEYRSVVLEANRQRLQPQDFVQYRRLASLKSNRCAANGARDPGR